jgi:small-conductance mechanosensitive channel
VLIRLLAAQTTWDKWWDKYYRHGLHIFEIIILALIAHLVMRRLLHRFVSHMTTGKRAPVNDSPSRQQKRAQTVSSALASLGAFVIWSIAVIMILSELGLNLAPLIAGAGIAGAALGFGAQQLVRDILAGMSMLAEDQFGIGDDIDVVDVKGTVEDVGLRTTRIRAADGVLWFVPNGEIKRLGNISASNK